MIDPSTEEPAAPAGRAESSTPDDGARVPAPEQSNGNGNGNGPAPAATAATARAAGTKARRPRQTTLGPSELRPSDHLRGSWSTRGASSSTITRSSSIVDEPAIPLGPPAPLDPPTAPATPAAKRASASTGLDLARTATPVVAPSTRPDTRRHDTLGAPLGPPPLLGPSIAHEPPPTQAALTSHDVAPVPRVLGRRPRVRKVTRVVRHVDPWSVFKIAAVFNLVLYGVALTAGVLLWNVAYATGTIDNLERFFESFGWDTFEFKGGEIYHSLWVAGLFGVVGLTGAAVLGATLFNLITDLVGGVRFTVLEEEVVERTAAPMRRFVVRRPSADGDPSSGLTAPTAPISNLPARAQRLAKYAARPPTDPR